MISRPLDLAANLRPAPRNFDLLFFVNGALLVLFFSLFGSSFVLAPSLGVDFKLARMAHAGMAQTTHHISVKREGQIFADTGQISLAQLQVWLAEQAKITRRPVLLVLADADVATSALMDVWNVAHEAGFDVALAAEPAPATSKPGQP